MNKYLIRFKINQKDDSSLLEKEIIFNILMKMLINIITFYLKN